MVRTDCKYARAEVINARANLFYFLLASLTQGREKTRLNIWGRFSRVLFKERITNPNPKGELN